jgi:hypothetical protein
MPRVRPTIHDMSFTSRNLPDLRVGFHLLTVIERIAAAAEGTVDTIEIALDLASLRRYVILVVAERILPS